MRVITVMAALVAVALAGPAFATDGGNANAEQQTRPVPNRGGTAGGPAHDAGMPMAAGEMGQEKGGASQRAGDHDASARHKH